MSETILVLNAGSSSIKFQLYDIGARNALIRRFKGQVQGIGTDRPHVDARDGKDRVLIDRGLDPTRAATVAEAQDALGVWLIEQLGGPPTAVGHRVVHGGATYGAPVMVDDAVLSALEALEPLAPLHQPHSLAAIRAIRARQPKLPQIACFDTAFHRSHPELADRFALPDSLYRQGVRRYGFHGLSYEFIVSRLPEVAPEIAGARFVVAHLGSGASACAIQGGRSMDSTMGFTALDGLPMGTRPGSLDPGVVLYLAAQGMAQEEIQRFLYHECGLKGLSGISNDVRILLASDEPAARMALDYFVYHTARAIASLAASMGGLEAVVFTGGIGEKATTLRAAILARCAWMGVVTDMTRNMTHGPLISAAGSAVRAYVIPTNEERMIARHTLAVLRGDAA